MYTSKNIAAEKGAKVEAEKTQVSKDIQLAYEVSMENPHQHYFEVKMSVSNLEQDELVVKLPVWTPGSYLVREFARNIDYFEVTDQKGNALEWNKVKKNAWSIQSKGASEVLVTYRVYAFEHSVRTSFLDADHGYINGASVFLYVDEHLELPSTVKINPYKDFKKISTSLKPVNGDQWTLSSPNYDILVDSPIEIGNQEIIEFEAGGVPHYFALVGEGNYKTDQMIKDVQKIVDEQVKMFGDMPCEDYTFILHNTENSYGGLEHLNSTCLIYPRWDYQPYDKYVRYLGLVSHEYFHLWNVKRIRPHALGPFDYETENYTQLLWMAEGLTSYFDDLILLRADLIKPNDYLNIVTKNLNRVENTPGVHVQSLSDASFDAWIKYYRKNENTNNCCISYYTKGALVAMALDLAIRHHTNNEQNVDQVLVRVYEDYYKKQGRGITEKEFQEVIEEVTGQSMDDFLQNYVYNTTPIDYNKYLAYAGLKLVNKNKGGKGKRLGVSTTNKDGRLMVKEVIRGGMAYEHGLNVHDEIIAINGYRVKGSLSEYLKNTTNAAGDEIEMIINRGGKIRTLNMPIGTDESFRYTFEKLKDVNDLQKKIYKDWLGEDF